MENVSALLTNMRHDLRVKRCSYVVSVVLTLCKSLPWQLVIEIHKVLVSMWMRFHRRQDRVLADANAIPRQVKSPALQ